MSGRLTLEIPAPPVPTFSGLWLYEQYPDLGMHRGERSFNPFDRGLDIGRLHVVLEFGAQCRNDFLRRQMDSQDAISIVDSRILRRHVQDFLLKLCGSRLAD